MIKFDYEKSYRKGRLITDEDTLCLIMNHFSQAIPNIEHLRKATGNPKLPSREYAVQPTGMFDIGIYKLIEEFLISEQITEIEYTDEFKSRLDCGFSVETVFDGLEYGNRYYGIETVQSALTNGCGTIVIGTGGGKSYITASLIENIWRLNKTDFKCIIIVPGLSLVNQLLGNFEEYKVNFTYSGWTGGPNGMPLQNTDVVICNSENFCAAFKNNEKWIRNVDMVVTDEAHKAKAGNQLTKYVSKIYTSHKFGFTGTLPKDKLDMWKILGTFGQIIYEKNSKELRDEKFLTDVTIKVVKLIHPKKKKRSYKNELSYLYNCESRNNIIRKIVENLNNNVLILVNNIEHGEILLETLEFPNRELYFVQGSMPVSERIKIVQRMESQTNIVCVAMSSIFSTGIDIKNLHYIMFVAGGKSFIRTVQSIGRGLRLHNTKLRLTIFDICDNMKSSEEHLGERTSFYDEEQIQWSETEISL